MGLKRYRLVFFVVFLVLLGLEIFALVKSPFIFVGLEERVWPFLLAAFILLIASFIPWRIFRNMYKIVNLVFLIFLGFSFVNIFWLDFKVIAFLIVTCILGGIKLLLEHFHKKKDLFLREEVYKYLFLAMLILISLGSFLDFFSSKMTGLSIITILLGVFVFYYNRDVIDEIEEEKEDEEKAEQKRAKEFDRKFPKLAWFNFEYGITKNWKEKRYLVSILRALAAPFVWFARLPYSFVKWMYKEGWWYSLGLIGILVLFVAVKIPYMDLTFTGLHEMKYSAIVEPAKHMYETNNLLLNQKKYLAVPIINPDGIYDSFGSYPIMEWGLVLMFNLFPNLGYELNARIFTALLGIIFLIGIYFLMKRFFSKKASLLVLFLISTNVIIQFFTYVTVMDTSMMIFFVFSLIALISGLEKNNMKLVFLAGILGGLGVNMKDSLLIISFFVYLFLILFWPKKKLSERLNYFLYFFPFLILEDVFFNISFKWLPKNPLLYGTIFIFVILFHWLFYNQINNLQSYSKRIFEKYFTLKRTIFIVLVGATLFLFVFMQSDRVIGMMHDFITDKYLIFNWPMYETFLERWQDWATNFGYYIGMIGFASLGFLIKDKKTKIFLYSLLASSFFYLIIASKVLYFHEYYHHIFMMTFLIFTGVLVYYAVRIYKPLPAILVIFLLITPIAIQNHKNTTEWLSKENNEGIMELGEYLRENMEEDEFFLTEGPAYLSFYSNRKSFSEHVLKEDPNLRNEILKKIEKKGMNETMRELKIRYYITKSKDNFDKEGFAYMFSEELSKKRNEKSFRSIIINCEENDICFYNENKEEINKIFEEKVRSYLKLEKKFEPFYIYSFY